INLKTITLFETSNQLNEVIIAGKKLPVRQTADKITINVSRNVLTSGGTATDILKQIPTVTVSTEGHISIRGKNDIDILIDGKPSGIVAAQGQNFLNQLDLSTVERIEIITNPSVVRSVSGAGGLINIIMKKDAKTGLNGNFNAGYGSDEWYHISPEINYRTGDFNLFMDYTFRHRKRLSKNSNVRDQIVTDGQQNIDQRQTGERIDKRHNVELGLDYYFNENEYITLSSNYRSRDKDDNQTRRTISTIGTAITESRVGHIQEPETNEGWGVTAQYNSNYSEEKSLSIILDYVHSVEDEIILREELVTTEVDEFIDGIQTFYVDTNDRLFLDLEHKIALNDHSELLYGAQGVYRKINQTFNALQYNNDNEVYESIDGSNDVFDYEDLVASIYGQYKWSVNKWSYETALRLEVWDNTYKSRSIDETFKNGYFKFFPSLKVAYDFSDNTNAVFSLKKGINRPSPNRLNPFPDISNAFNVSIGNPELDPEIFYNMETGFNFRINKITISTALFFTLYNDMIQRVTALQDDGITLTIPININNMYHYGLDLSFQTNITKWLSQQLGGLLYKRSFDDDFIDTSEKVVYQIKGTTTIQLTDNLEAQIFGSYNAPENTPQGEIDALYYLDTGLEYKFWKNNARIALVITDIFDTLREKTTLTDENLSVFNDSKINTRRMYVTFKYTF
ncbi:MAG: TonB-dependent receptor, partial [Bacteroidota bacterium]